MRFIHVSAAIKSLNSPVGVYEADFLVDTGTTDSLAPVVELRKISVQPVETTTYSL